MLSFQKFFYLQEAKFRGGAKEGDAVGWLKKSVGSFQWIALDTSNEDEPDLHDNPKYISQLEPELEKKFQEENPGYEYEYDSPERDKLKDECISRGHVRVAEMVGMKSITLQGRDLDTLKKAMIKLKELFPNKMNKFEVQADVILGPGKYKSFEWNPQENKWVVFRGDSYF